MTFNEPRDRLICLANRCNRYTINRAAGSGRDKIDRNSE
jgi:hypothetical protein